MSTDEPFQGQKRGETWSYKAGWGEPGTEYADAKTGRIIVGCSQDGCDNDAALQWYCKQGDLTSPPEVAVNCPACDDRLDAEAEARREERVVSGYSEDRITELLLGHSVVQSLDGALVLDDGTRLEIATAGDCCSWYSVQSLNDSPNIITSVEFDYDYGAYVHGESEGDTLRIFVLAEDKRINLVEVDGNPGSGCYATGYQFVVTRPGDPAPESDWYVVKT